MKRITFPGGGKLTGLANMLELMGHDVEDKDIALGMEAPYLFVHDAEGYKSGAGLYHPQWMNLYLHPHGFHLDEQIITKEKAGAYLRSHVPSMLRIKIDRFVTHPMVFSGYENGRYTFMNIKPRSSSEPDRFALTAASLKNRLEECVTVYTLTSCIPQAVDFLPYLTASLDNLDTYLAELLDARQRVMSRTEFISLNPLFRPLMKDLQPMMALIGDDILAEELRQLAHDYTHVFTLNSEATTALYDHLPKGSVIKSITWLRENILDRLCELGASEAVLTQKAVFPRKKPQL